MRHVEFETTFLGILLIVKPKENSFFIIRLQKVACKGNGL